MKYLTNYDKVREFNLAFDRPIDAEFSEELLALADDLISEEYLEVTDELEAEEVDRAKLTKELVDLLYVTYFAGVTFGIDLDAAFDEVHRSNMSKLGLDGKPVVREDGKVLKGPNYTPANMERFA